MQGKNRCINLILGQLNTGTYQLLEDLPPPPTGEILRNNPQHPVVFKTSRLQDLTGLEWHSKGCRGEDVWQAVSTARCHMKARQEAVGNRCRPECTQARFLCRLDGPQELRGGHHGIKVRQPWTQGPRWLQIREEEGAPLVYFHQVKHMWVGYVDGWSGTSGEGAEADEQQVRAEVLTAPRVEPKQAVL